MKPLLDIHTAIPLCLFKGVHSVTSYICWGDVQHDSTLCMRRKAVLSGKSVDTKCDPKRENDVLFPLGHTVEKTLLLVSVPVHS